MALAGFVVGGDGAGSNPRTVNKRHDSLAHLFLDGFFFNIIPIILSSTQDGGQLVHDRVRSGYSWAAAICQFFVN